MAYTNATVIVAAADQAAAQVDFPGSFVSAFTDPTGATFYVCSGLWRDADLTRITDGSVVWPSRVYYGGVAAVLEGRLLKPVDATASAPDLMV